MLALRLRMRYSNIYRDQYITPVRHRLWKKYINEGRVADIAKISLRGRERGKKKANILSSLEELFPRFSHAGLRYARSRTRPTLEMERFARRILGLRSKRVLLKKTVRFF